MRRILKHWVLAAVMAIGFGGTTLTVMTSPIAMADAACDKRLLTIPPWYKDLTGSAPACNIKSPTEVGGISNFVWRVALNIIEIMLHLVGYIAVTFIIIGGFRYMTSTGTPDGMAKARQTILNAVIGLVISLLSVAIVNAVQTAVRGGL